MHRWIVCVVVLVVMGSTVGHAAFMYEDRPLYGQEKPVTRIAANGGSMSGAMPSRAMRMTASPYGMVTPGMGQMNGAMGMGLVMPTQPTEEQADQLSRIEAKCASEVEPLAAQFERLSMEVDRELMMDRPDYGMIADQNVKLAGLFGEIQKHRWTMVGEMANVVPGIRPAESDGMMAMSGSMSGSMNAPESIGPWESMNAPQGTIGGQMCGCPCCAMARMNMMGGMSGTAGMRPMMMPRAGARQGTMMQCPRCGGQMQSMRAGISEMSSPNETAGETMQCPTCGCRVNIMGDSGSSSSSGSLGGGTDSGKVVE